MREQKRKIIIISLVGLLLIMAISYAAFSSVLNIQGTTSISSNWNIKITNVTSKDIVGSASNQEEPSWENLTATFNTNLVSPGDSITYEITVSNEGTLNAKLDKITLSDTNNPAIKFETSGLTEGDILNAGSNTTLNVKVSYDINVSSDPVNKVGELTVTLDYSQASSSTPSGGVLALTKITELVESNPEEIYTDDKGNIRYYGADPNNYVTFNNELWRIIGIVDGKVKIVRNELLTPVETDNGVTIGISDGFYWNYVQQEGKNLNNWEGSTLQTYLNGTYYNSIDPSSQAMIEESTFYLGGPTYSNYLALTASGYYDVERSSSVYSDNPTSTVQKIGLMYPSDYGYATAGGSTTSKEVCLATALFSWAGSSVTDCKNNDYLYNSSKDQWTQTLFLGSSGSAIIVSSTSYVDYEFFINAIGVRPVLYLTSETQIVDGVGASSDPFILG